MSRRNNPYARPDARSRSARATGYPARSVFKLKEIDERFKLFRAGQRVLDLGAAPGSWSLYASERTGPTGRVLAVDLQEIRQAFPSNVTVIRGDAFELAPDVLVVHAPFDVVLSDMAPSTSGDKSSDRAMSYRLFAAALEAAERHLVAGGAFVGKIFMGGDFEEAKRSVRSAFRVCKTVKPRGTRQRSSELYLIGLGREEP